MRVKHGYSFRIDDSTLDIVNFLKRNKIKHKIGTGIPILTLEIFEDNKHWEKLKNLMSTHHIHSISECVFSKKEYDRAEWFSIRSKWRSQYPQPEDEYKKVTYDASGYCSGCGCGLVQKNNFMLKKSPNWGKKNFLMIHWVENELFVNDKIYHLLDDEDINGLRFLPVMKLNQNKPLDNIKQLKISNTLDSGMLVSEVDISKVDICPQCHAKKYLLSGTSPLVYRKDIFKENIDIAKSSELFGDGLVCLKIIFISRRLYELFYKHGWQKELAIEPINLV